MKCPNCGIDMENGYSLQLGLAGTIRVVKNEHNLTSGGVAVSVCPGCGKVELHVDYKSIK